MLHDLVVLRKTLLQNYNTQEVEHALEKLRIQIDNVKTHVDSIEPDNVAYIDNLSQYYATVLDQVKSPHDEFNKKIKEIDAKISEVSHKLFVGNYELEEKDGGVEHIRTHRKLYLRPEVEQKVSDRIKLHTNWQYPALEIGCREGDWTEHLVAADPLYVFDKYKEFLEATNSRFPPEYQARLRKYLNKNYDFSVLPSGQFGFIFSWNHFNYVSLDTMTQVLKQIKSLLRPGGVFMFSYNNGDTPAGAGLAENFAQTYLPKSLLEPTIIGVGLEIIQSFDEEPNISWMECKLPGQLRSTKAHQVMGEIKKRFP